MIIQEFHDGISLVHCVCGHIYRSSTTKNTKVIENINYPCCKMCGKTEGIANIEKEQLIGQ